MALQKLVNFWHRYENLNIRISFILISFQIVHLYWLTIDIVLPRIFGDTIFVFPGALVPVVVIIDYIEIPALISGITFYLLSIYKHRNIQKNLLFLILLAIQVFHIFWITDEVVYNIFFGQEFLTIPLYAAWIAILIDYLELPVMGDLFYRIIKNQKKNNGIR